MRIAIVQVGWPIQSYTRDLVNGLVGQSHHVDFVAAAGDDRGMIEPGSMRGRVTLLQCSGIAADFRRRLRGRLAGLFHLDLPINPAAVLKEADRFFSGQARYDVLIGVEKAGLELADRHGRQTGTPVIYYSLELYVEGHPEQGRFAWQRANEVACHARAQGTLIQDRFRWEVLRQANRIVGDAVYFLPIGISAARNVSAPCRTRPAPTQSDCRLLSFGVQGKNRLTHELIAQAVHLPTGQRLQLHGPAYDSETLRLAKGRLPVNVALCTRLLPEAELPALLAEADIGLALYRIDVANDRLTAYSSQKVALYLQAGLPVVAFRSEAFADMFSRFPCGELIAEIVSSIGNSWPLRCSAWISMRWFNAGPMPVAR